ncbi:MAG: hypothetical protein JXQ73_07970 [Phycisphaerae bacterium]|nr:hypothetical protein [Phycisphaerae bacterium]
MADRDADESNAQAGHPGVRSPAEALTDRQQTANGLYYALIVSINYLVAPVSYVDLMHAALCNTAGASKTVANLPTSMGAFFGLVPLVAAWVFPYTRWIRPVMSYGYLCSGIGGLIVPIVLICPSPDWLKILATILHAAILMTCSGTAGVFIWEAVVRGTSERKRGRTFSITYGIGPFFAVASSAAAQKVLDLGAYPYSFAAIFFVGSLLLLVNAVLARRFQIPDEDEVVRREPFIVFIVGGLKSFLTSRTLIALGIAYVLFYAALVAMNNAMLNVESVLGVEPKQMTGWCSALRFGAKGLAGLGLGLLLARYGARSPALATSLALVMANVWTMVVPGYAYLVAFGLFGAGELGGLYYPHYLAAASRPDRLKRNIAIYQIVGTLGSAGAAVLGFVADHWGTTASMGLAVCIASVAMFIFLMLPAKPRAET